MSSEKGSNLHEELKSFFSDHKDDLGLDDGTIKKLCEHFLENLMISTFSDLRDVLQGDIPLTIVKRDGRKKIMECIANNVSLREIDAGPSSDDTLMRDFIKRCGLSPSAELDLGDFIEDELDCSTVSDFKDVERRDIEIKVSPVELNRFLRLFNEEVKGQPKMGLKVAKKPVEPVPSAVSTAPSNEVVKTISVTYIFYNHPVKGVSRNSVDVNPETTKMKDLILQIMIHENTDPNFTLELFSSDGYPLNNNDFTNECTLQKWKIQDKDTLYAFSRKKLQPVDCKFRSLPKVNHSQGDAEVQVITQLHGDVKIRIDSVDESPEDLCKKVYSATNVPTTHMSLYLRNPVTHQCTELDVKTKLKHGDTITMLLKNPAEEALKYAEVYGKTTYNPTVAQNDRGMSAFLSILRYVCEMQGSTVDFSKFLRLVLQESRCPPLVYALQVLHEERWCSLPCWVALMEGCFVILKDWLSAFTDQGKIPDSEVFEFSDYFWGVLLKLYEKEEKNLKGTSFETTRMSLLCGATGLKVVSPVLVASDEEDCRILYDKQSAIEKNVLCKEDTEVANLLMSNPWKSNREVLLWKEQLPKTIEKEKFECPYKWFELADCLDVLIVSSPSHLLGMGSLTFVEKGHYVLYMGFAKDNDKGQVVYDPLQTKLVRRRKEDLCEIASEYEGKNVTSRDLTEVVSDKDKHDAAVDIQKARPKPIVVDYGTNWVAEEAIMVLVDVSGSMDCLIYQSEFTSLDIAKELFSAYRLRTQAYNLPNAVGLIGFGSKVTRILDLRQCSDEFEDSLEKLKISGCTALNDAMKEAADCLKRYKADQTSISRRILCLTDGYDNGSHAPYDNGVKITSYLLERGIIVDTVIIDDAGASGDQKAITHATGGACFLPDSLEAGLKLFEMEAFLSYKLRATNKITAKSISEEEFARYRDVSKYPFDEILECNALINPLPKTTAITKMAIGAGYHSQSRIKRITDELTKFKNSTQTNLEVFPNESNVTVWIVLMKGPEYTPYSNGAFLLQVKFPENYPSQPPEVRFHSRTPIYHCNISSTGRICHKILSECYCTRFDMRDILGSIYHLLMCPEQDSPLDSVIGETLSFAPEEYMRKAKEETLKHALPGKDFNKIAENMRNGLGPVY